MDEHVVAAARATKLEAESLDQPPHVRERDVRDITSGEPRKEPPRIHVVTLTPRTDGVPGSGELGDASGRPARYWLLRPAVLDAGASRKVTERSSLWSPGSTSMQE